MEAPPRAGTLRHAGEARTGAGEGEPGEEGRAEGEGSSQMPHLLARRDHVSQRPVATPILVGALQYVALLQHRWPQLA